MWCSDPAATGITTIFATHPTITFPWINLNICYWKSIIHYFPILIYEMCLTIRWWVYHYISLLFNCFITLLLFCYFNIYRNRFCITSTILPLHDLHWNYHTLYVAYCVLYIVCYRLYVMCYILHILPCLLRNFTQIMCTLVEP